jgi:hypothetical protein
MPTESEAQAAQRRALLVPVARLCAEAGVPVGMGRLERPGEASVVALACTAPDGTWDATLTVVRARPISTEYQDWNGRWGRDPHQGYDLASPGALVYELQVHEEDDGAGGHGPRPVVVFELVDGEQAAADALILWWFRSGLFHATPPGPDPRADRRRERAEQHRRTAAAEPQVRLGPLPAAAADAAARLDPAALSRNFPRAHDGHFHRSAIVALAPIDDVALHRRGGWLAARRDGDGLALTVAELIGANQAHRWDVTPWLWDSRVRATRRKRWQVDRADQARPILAALRSGEVAHALEIAGVAADDQVTRLLTGAPTRSFRAELAERWVQRLHTGLADAAPWRFAEACRVWRSEVSTRSGRGSRPVTLFGLKGLNQARKPKIALDLDGGTPVVRLVFTAGNLVLPRSLWTVPPDFPS